MSKPIAAMSDLDANMWIEAMKACGRSGHYFEMGPNPAMALALYVEALLKDRNHWRSHCIGEVGSD